MGGVTHTYDLRGNLTSDGTNNYTYDLDNRLTGINGTISYEYDPFGRRIRKTVNGTGSRDRVDTDQGPAMAIGKGVDPESLALLVAMPERDLC